METKKTKLTISGKPRKNLYDKQGLTNNKNNQIFRLNNEEHFSKYGIWNFKLNYFYPKCYGFIQNNIYHYNYIYNNLILYTFPRKIKERFSFY